MVMMVRKLKRMCVVREERLLIARWRSYCCWRREGEKEGRREEEEGRRGKGGKQFCWGATPQRLFEEKVGDGLKM